MTSAFEETTFSFSDNAPPPPGERRQQARHLPILRVGTLISEDDRELCLVRNISAGGLTATVYSANQSDTRTAVDHKTKQQIQGIVAEPRRDTSREEVCLPVAMTKDDA